MSRLVLVRHGQASFFGPEYDELSSTGIRQSEALGTWWAGRPEDRPTKVYVGPRRRHHQTLSAIQAGLTAEDGPVYEPSTADALDEYPALEVVRRHLPDLLAKRPDLSELLPALQEKRPDAPRLFQKAFEEITTDYVEGRIEHDDLESWPDFRQRVTTGLEDILNRHPEKETVAVITSGGPMAVFVGHILGLTDRKVLELSWQIRNAALVEILYKENRRTLAAFNTAPHLVAENLHTYR